MSSSSMSKKFESLIAECDALIKAGKMNAVAHLISQINMSQVPRSSRQALAKICRRSGQIASGLRLLQPIIRHEKEIEEAPTAAEINEYAVLLSRNGSTQEALNLLETVDPETAPETWLYQAFCHISNWDCDLSEVLLEKFLQSSADSYTKLIAKVNLASSCIAIQKLDRAEELLRECIEAAQAAGASRLIGNCWELLGQVYIHRQNFSKAREILDRALSLLGGVQTYDQLLIYKWQSVMTALETKDPEPLIEFRKEAVRRHHWESVREADLFSAKVHFDQKTFDSVYFGTPMRAYRDRILHQIPFEPSEFFLLGKDTSLWMDLQTGEMHGSGALNAGKKIHQVVSALTRDFYVPRNVGTLFAELYPDEFFDINSSALRIRQWLRRTRRWMEAHEISAQIQQVAGNYQLILEGDFGIRIPRERELIASQSVKWQQLRMQFPQGTWFTAEQACQALNISRSTFHRLVQWGVEQGQILKAGSGRSTQHQVLKPSPQKSEKEVA